MIQEPEASSTLGFSQQHCGAAPGFLRGWVSCLPLELLPSTFKHPSTYKLAALESDLGFRSWLYPH